MTPAERGAFAAVTQLLLDKETECDALRAQVAALTPPASPPTGPEQPHG